MAGVLTGNFRDAALGAVREMSRDVLDFFYPPACVICNRLPEDRDPVCRRCAASLATLSFPVCLRCRSFIPPAANRCPAGHRRLPSLVWSLGLFDSHYRTLIHAFKFKERLDCGLFVARRLAALVAADPRSARIDVVASVPLHPARARERGFNQSEHVATAIGAALEKPVRHDLLRRIRNTPSQTEFSRRDRHRNVAGAFAVGRLTRGERVLVVDDVATTGATLGECATLLKKEGARNVLGAVVALAETDF